MSTHTITDIDGVPTAIVPRGDNQPPIILYTIQPPPYSHYQLYRLIMQGPPPLDKQHSPCDSDDIYIEEYYKSVCLVVFVISCVLVCCISVAVFTRVN